MRDWVKKARKGNESTLRHLLRDYVLILANTGMRPGTETMNLKWQHITLIEQNGKKYLAFNVKGKTGRREILVRHRVARYLERIKERDDDLKDMTLYQILEKGVDKYVFRVDNKDMSTAFGRMFSRLLESIDLLVDKRTDDKRTLYSIRHFYATRALTRTDITPYQLADFMGTSVGMLKAHYGHLDLRQIADKFAGTGTIDAELRKPKQQDDDDDVIDVKKSVKRKTASKTETDNQA
jgi:integrase